MKAQGPSRKSSLVPGWEKNEMAPRRTGVKNNTLSLIDYGRGHERGKERRQPLNAARDQLNAHSGEVHGANSL